MATPYPRSVVSEPGASPPRRSRHRVTSADGAQLFLHIWRPQTRPVRAVLLLMHGIGMHAGPYDGVAEGFTREGILLAVPDLRGHGSSAGRRGLLPTRRQRLEDGDAHVEFLRGAAPGVPLFMAGESMGGLLGADHARQRQDRFEGLVLVVPAFQVHPSRFLAPPDLGALLRRGHSVVDTEENLGVASRDPQFIRAKMEDPLVNHSVHLSYLLQLGWTGLRWRWLASQLRLPLLVLLAGRDAAISNVMARRVYRSVGTPQGQKQLRVWEDAYHTLFWDPVAEEVVTAMTEWIDGRLEESSPAPSLPAF